MEGMPRDEDSDVDEECEFLDACDSVETDADHTSKLIVWYIFLLVSYIHQPA